MKRKLKKLEQILAEFPEHKFGDYELELNYDLAISLGSLMCLGKKTDSEWDERLLEPLPEPKVRKLYAYSSGTNTVFFSVFDVYVDYKRLPEYDIEYPEKGEQ
jgi:hypothetical protein